MVHCTRDTAGASYTWSFLSSRTHPTSRRLDGSGGDEGRDVYFPGPTGESIFQLKSFKGRLTSSRKGQVRHSLERAAGRAPARWWLVVPIDPTPTEERWFADLKQSVPFPIEWLGRTWLDSEFARFPEISEYFIQDHRDEVLRLLVEMRQKDLAIQDAVDATERLRRLYARLNKIDPYFRYDIGLGPSVTTGSPSGAVFSVCSDDVRVSVFEQYPGALVDRPILAHVELTFAADDLLIEKVSDAFDYGRAVSVPATAVSRFTIDAPAGLGGDFRGGTLDIGASRVLSDSPLAVEAHIERDGKRRAVLSFRCDERTVGLKGTVMEGVDESGWLTLKMVVTPAEKRMNVTFTVNPVPRLPAALVPMVRWAQACSPPNILKIKIDGHSFGEMSIPEPWFSSNAAELILMLAFLQEETGSYFPMPLELTTADWEDVRESYRLLKGERLESTWTRMSFEMATYEPAGLRRLLKGENAFRFVREEWLVLDERRIPLGEVTTALPTAKPESARKLRMVLERQPSTISVHLVPGSTDALVRFVSRS